jgi:hypothetical protein
MQTLTVHGPITNDAGYRPQLEKLTEYDKVAHAVDSDQRLHVICYRGDQEVRRLEYAAGGWSCVDIAGVAEPK